MIKSDTDIDSETVENVDSSKWEDVVESARIIFIIILIVSKEQQGHSL